MDSNEDFHDHTPAKGILKVNHICPSTLKTEHQSHLKRASFSDDPILIQFSQQFNKKEENKVTTTNNDEQTTSESGIDDNWLIPQQSPICDMQRRKSFEERRKEFYEGQTVNIRLLLAKKPEELVQLEQENESIDLTETDEQSIEVTLSESKPTITTQFHSTLPSTTTSSLNCETMDIGKNVTFS